MPSKQMSFTAVFVLLAWLCLLQPVAGQLPATQPDQHRKTSTPYTGDLSIFDTPGRDQKLHINQVMDILDIAPGKNVADIGAGSGWFSVRAARRGSKTGTVYAVDINPEALHYIKNRAAQEHLTNIVTVLGQADKSPLPADHVDSVLMLKSYHEIAEPVALLRNLRPALRPDARVGIIDRNGSADNHGVQKDIVIREAEQAGYRLAGQHNDLVKDDKEDYFLVFVRK